MSGRPPEETAGLAIASRWKLRGLALLLGLIWLALRGATMAASAQTAADYGCAGTIHLSFYEFGPLYHDGVGIDRDVVDEMIRRTGCTIVTDVKPRAEIWRELQSNQLDMTTSGLRTDTRDLFAYFIPYVALNNVVITDRKLAPQITSFDDVLQHPEWKIGVVKSYLLGPYFDYRLKAARPQVVFYPDQNDIFQALWKREVQVIIAPAFDYEFYFSGTIEQQIFTTVDVSPAPPVPQNMIFSRQRFTPAQINAWGGLFEQMRLDGTLERIFRKRVSNTMIPALLNY